MKLTFLGVGSAFSKKNANSNLLIESGKLKLIIDCGHTTPAALERVGLSLKDITHILITHLHHDHIGGLEEVAFMTRLVFKNRVTLMSTASILERLWHCSLKGGLEFIEVVPGDLQPQRMEDFFQPQSFAMNQWNCIEETTQLKFYMHPTKHVLGLESYAIEIAEREGRKSEKILFSGDSKFSEELIHYALDNCAMMFHDCQVFDSGPGNAFGVHTSYNQLNTLPANIKKRLWLYHFGDDGLPVATNDGFAGFVAPFQSIQI